MYVFSSHKLAAQACTGAIPLIFGRLTTEDYSDKVAADPRIDALRAKMQCVEESAFSFDSPHQADPLQPSFQRGLPRT